jgi:hypothetical protein
MKKKARWIAVGGDGLSSSRAFRPLLRADASPLEPVDRAA